MTSNDPQREPTLADISRQITDISDRLDSEVKRWDERFFQLTRDNLTTSRTIIITAGSVILLSPVLQALAPAIQTIVARLIGAELQP
jgi:hypothetical protein